MRIGGENRPTWIQPRHWERFSADGGIKAGLIRRIVDEMSEKLAPAADSLAQDFTSAYGGTTIVGKIIRLIKQPAAGQKPKSSRGGMAP
jgi:serine/threonine-protein kinase HipA